MTQQIINIGTEFNDPDNDLGRPAFDKCNDNFTELYNDKTIYGLSNSVKTRYFLSGAWNMDTDASIKVSLDLTDISVYALSAMVKKDSEETYYPINYKNNGSIFSEDDGITLERVGSGFFDGADFDGAGNRALIKMDYTSDSSTLKSWEAGYTGS